MYTYNLKQTHPFTFKQTRYIHQQLNQNTHTPHYLLIAQLQLSKTCSDSNNFNNKYEHFILFLK